MNAQGVVQFVIRGCIELEEDAFFREAVDGIAAVRLSFDDVPLDVVPANASCCENG